MKNKTYIAKYWKEYYVLIRWRGRGLILRNNWHEWNTDQWHLFSLYRKWLNGRFNYYFALLGFQLQLIDYRDRKSK